VRQLPPAQVTGGIVPDAICEPSSALILPSKHPHAGKL
jgi:hypothetical protein